MIRDTIAAISTGMTASGIGKVRLSGDDAIEIAAIRKSTRLRYRY